jgi:hypothetical protein
MSKKKKKKKKANLVKGDLSLVIAQRLGTSLPNRLKKKKEIKKKKEKKNSPCILPICTTEWSYTQLVDFEMF